MMIKMIKKIKCRLSSRKGETLIEILVAVLIIAMSAGLFATMYTASMNINLSARRQDEAMYDAVGKLENMEGSGGTDAKEGTVQYEAAGDNAYEVTPGKSEAEVDILTQDGMSVYKSRK